MSAYSTIAELWNADVAAERFVKLSNAILEGDKTPNLFSTGPCSCAEIVREDWYKNEAEITETQDVYICSESYLGWNSLLFGKKEASAICRVSNRGEYKNCRTYFCTGTLCIGANCWIGRNLTVHGNGSVIIGDNCDIAPDVTFLPEDT